jgi:hypothetical protein
VLRRQSDLSDHGNSPRNPKGSNQMTLSQFILYPLTHRMVTESAFAEMQRGLASLAQHIENTSLTRDRKVPRKARTRHLIAAE